MVLSDPELDFAPDSAEPFVLLELALEPESPELPELSDLLDFVEVAELLDPESLFLLSEEPFVPDDLLLLFL